MTTRYTIQQQEPPDHPEFPWLVLDAATGQPCEMAGRVLYFPDHWTAQSYAWWEEQLDAQQIIQNQ